MGSSFALENTHFVERKEIIDENDQNHRNNYSYDLKFTSGGEFTFTINEDDRIRREGGGTLKNLVMVILTGKASAEEDSDKNLTITFNVDKAMKDKGGFMGIPELDSSEKADFKGFYNQKEDTLKLHTFPKTTLDKLQGLLKRVGKN